ncbi:MAG: phosphate acyltransferase PlsX [gamma proteobacterium symbiont of Bathyaustriella thionipta]|nr:phosphate acyltransferase PlsX [gamma proteobacterium symbiont of Bathyaustriella thionipta]
MSKTVSIALDAMSGDLGPASVIPAAREMLVAHPQLRLILVGDEDVLKQHLDGYRNSRLSLQHASEVVAMDESPAKVLRLKKDSSMRVAINLVKSGEAAACVSAGNTGALMATARFVLKMLPNIDRPAIITALPSIEGRTFVLDLGANVDCSAEHLLQFGVMGSERVEAAEGIAAPRVGLLNIGEEDTKGNEQVKQAHQLLSASHLNYIGFVEGNDVYKGGVDVVVSDGFVGNVALKTAEGVAKMISHNLKAAFKANLYGRLAALVALPVLKNFRRKIDPRRYNGASLLGLKGIVVKSHGGADALAFANAIGVAMREVEHNVPNRIAQRVAGHLSGESKL